MTAKDDALAALAAHHAKAQQIRAQLDAETLRLVAAARQHGASWEKVGDALGQLRNNARRKFEPLLDETVTRQVRVKTTDSSGTEKP